jgi:RimJ/RimL family protein N-acetyltransferase
VTSPAGNDPGHEGDPSHGAATEAALTGLMRTRRLQFRPLRPEDTGPLYRMALDPEVTFQWRLRGATPSIEEFSRQLHQTVLCQFVVTPVDSADLLGLVVAYNPDFRHRFVHAAAVMRPAVLRRGLGVEALLGLGRYLFFGWDFRMVLLDTNSFTYRAFASGERAGLFEVTGRIPGQYYLGGQWWDGLTLVHRREHFDAFMASPLGRALLPGNQVLRTD